jgi:hypothetical protein
LITNERFRITFEGHGSGHGFIPEFFLVHVNDDLQVLPTTGACSRGRERQFMPSLPIVKLAFSRAVTLA